VENMWRPRGDPAAVYRDRREQPPKRRPGRRQNTRHRPPNRTHRTSPARQPHRASNRRLPVHDPADCAEAEAIVDRVSDTYEDPERARERRKILLHLALMEAEALDMLKHDQPRLRNRNTDHSIRALLRNIRRERAQWTGIPAPC
jgi:hypothetical protein